MTANEKPSVVYQPSATERLNVRLDSETVRPTRLKITALEDTKCVAKLDKSAIRGIGKAAVAADSRMKE